MKQIQYVIFFFLIFIHSAQAATVGFATAAGGLGDNGFNDMTYTGLRKAQQRYGFRLVLAEAEKTGIAGETELKNIIEQSETVVFLGDQYKDLGKMNAEKYPEKRFLILDIEMKDLPNLVSVMFKQHEGSFLAGVLAGSMTKTATVGFVGGAEIPIIHAFRVGYEEGVRYANPAVKIISSFASGPDDYSGFDNPKKGFDMASEQYAKGADILFAAAGLTGNGVIEAARQNKKFVIGVDSDQDAMAKGYVLTSMLKRLDTAVFNEISKVMENRFEPGVRKYGLKEKGVSLTEMKYTKQLIPKEVSEKISAAEEKIISGQIKVSDYLESVSK
jgi:basic membrane protein A and related proteins